jgi:hypothetical protein
MLKVSRGVRIGLILFLCASGCASSQELSTARPSDTPQASAAASPTEVFTVTTITPTQAFSPTPQGSTPITPEEYAVYDAMIKHIFIPYGVKAIVIVDQTAAGISDGLASQQDLEYLQKNLAPDLQAETLSDFVAKNDRSYQVENHFSLDVPVVLFSNEAVDKFFAADDGWNRFYDQYPNSQGLMKISRVGFDPGKEQALMYVGNQADFLAGQGDYVLLSKEGGVWQVDTTVLAWIS